MPCIWVIIFNIIPIFIIYVLKHTSHKHIKPKLTKLVVTSPKFILTIGLSLIESLFVTLKKIYMSRECRRGLKDFKGSWRETLRICGGTKFTIITTVTTMVDPVLYSCTRSFHTLLYSTLIVKFYSLVTRFKSADFEGVCDN